MNRVSKLLSIALLLVSCGGYKEKEQEALAYKIKTIKIESETGCSKDPCASFEVSYPEFANVSEEIRRELLDKINAAIGYDNPEAEGFTIEQMGERFVADFEKYNQAFPDTTFSWYFITNFDVLIAVDTLISLAANSEYFTGGAHGGFSVYYVNIDPFTGHEVELQDLLKPGFENALNREGEKSFRRARGLSDTDNLYEQGFEFRDGKFSVNNNYGFRQEGIVFFFNNYEIASYAQGPTEIIIPWEVLSDWRK